MVQFSRKPLCPQGVCDALRAYVRQPGGVCRNHAVQGHAKKLTVTRKVCSPFSEILWNNFSSIFTRIEQDLKFNKPTVSEAHSNPVSK